MKILCDRNLIKSYFQIYSKRLDSKNKDTFELIKVVSNPWYQDESLVERRITDIPFGMIIFDEREIGMEIIDKNEKENFRCGILIKDKKAATTMINFYDKMWQSAMSG